MANEIAFYTGRQFRIDNADLANLSVDEQLRYVCAQLQEQRLVPPGMSVEALSSLVEIYQKNALAHQRYQGGMYSGEICVIAAEESVRQRNGDETLGWSQVTSEAPETIVIPTDHYGIIRPPHAATVANLLRLRLSAGQ